MRDATATTAHSVFQPPGRAVKLPRDPRLCPLCRRPRENPAAAPSGIVYCFSCLHEHSIATDGGDCPVTGTPCPPSRIRRLILDP